MGVLMINYFYNEYMCIPVVVNEFLYDLAEYYHKTCDEYDAVVCSGKWKNNEPYPVDAWERERIISHAYRVRKEIMELAKNKGYGADEVLKAIRNHPLNK